MSSSQNVKAALSGGWVAILVGIFATVACYLLIPVLSKFSKKNIHLKDQLNENLN